MFCGDDDILMHESALVRDLDIKFQRSAWCSLEKMSLYLDHFYAELQANQSMRSNFERMVQVRFPRSPEISISNGLIPSSDLGMQIHEDKFSHWPCRIFVTGILRIFKLTG